MINLVHQLSQHVPVILDELSIREDLLGSSWNLTTRGDLIQEAELVHNPSSMSCVWGNAFLSSTKKPNMYKTPQT